MDWQKPTKLDEGVEIPRTWIHLHYYEALTVLFRVENALRTFVYIVLKEKFASKWQDLDISSDDESRSTIAALAKKRIAQDDAFGYLGYRINSHLMYLTSGELVRLITSDSYWPHFAKYFRSAKNVTVLKLQEIGNIRNSLAHFRPIQPGDVEVVKQNANQMLRGVEQTLSEAMICDEIVPTNTEDPWYRNLSTVGSQLCTLSFRQSRSREWTTITLRFSSPPRSDHTAAPLESDSYVFNSVLTIETPAVLMRGDEFCAHLIALIERIPYLRITKHPHPKFFKDLRFIVSRDFLSSGHEVVKKYFEKLLETIERETDLISQDNLARGTIVREQTLLGEKTDKGLWSFNTDLLLRPVRAGDPIEYWGNVVTSGQDLISDITEFPWLPVNISTSSFE
ncbi:MAG TPA: hypothetical protein VHQ90_00445 [Thermoanaerobaculia bacterium]|nr:hypothetical protein [Thermoanaerobaculia bacterium]